VPGTGDFGSYQDYDGTEVRITGTGMLPWYMWNATDGMYSNVFYGANFVDYVGYVGDKLTMIRPVNGKDYDSYIYGQYFDLAIDGAQAADNTALAAIRAIKAIPERVSYEDRALVEAARAAYTKIATIEQQAQVTNYADLISAEQRITALTPTEEPSEEIVEEVPTENSGWAELVAALVILALSGVALWLLLRSDEKPVEAPEAAEIPAAEAPAAPEEAPETETEDPAEE
jgi:hypothetical protein